MLLSQGDIMNTYIGQFHVYVVNSDYTREYKASFHYFDNAENYSNQLISYGNTTIIVYNPMLNKSEV